MTTALARPELSAQIEQVLIGGDLSRLSPAERVSYYNNVCSSLGLNPLTRPFDYIRLNGKEVLYAKRDCTEQLRKIHGVSVTITAREVVEDCYVVTARATDRSGRADESIGVVPIANLKGEARANAMMKGETKAKRRVTLSICGMGLLDETEVDSIPGAVRHDPKDHGGQTYSPPSIASANGVTSTPSPALSTASSFGRKVGVMGLADEEEPPNMIDDEYTEPVPIFDPATGEQIGMAPALTSKQAKEIEDLLTALGHHMDEKKGREIRPRGLFFKKTKEKFVKDGISTLFATHEAAWCISWLRKCVAKKEAAMEGPTLVQVVHQRESGEE